jgi:1-acyl-sn-glycerol-3-phosphate acyltransferase
MTSFVNVRSKKVPTLYEADESKYAGPHRWQTQSWARGIRRLMRYKAYTRWVASGCTDVQVVGLEHLENLEGPAIFIANHQSHLDTPVVHAALPERVRKKIYFGAAQDRWFVRGKKKLTLKPWYQSLVLGNFPILRGGGKRALAHAAWLLEQGQHVFLFPEGTRSTNEELGEFKHGATLLALNLGVPVVPMHLHGLQQIRPKGCRTVTKGTARVEILPPVYLQPDSDVAETTNLLRSQLNRVHASVSQRAELKEAVKEAVSQAA